MRNGEADHGHLTTAAGASARSWPGEKRNDCSRTPNIIAKIKMVAAGIVEIHSPLDQAQAERLGVKIEIGLRISRNRGDVMDAGAAHGNLEGETVTRTEDLAMNF